MSTENRLEQVVALFDRSSATYIKSQNTFRLSVTMTDESKLLLTELDQDGLTFDFETDNGKDYFQENDVTLGKQYTMKVEPIHLREIGLLIYTDWEDFFSFPEHLSVSPEAFYIFDSKDIFLGDESNLKKTMKCYIDTLHLISCLNKCSDHKEQTTKQHCNIIFLHKARLDIECIYALDDIKHGIDGITTIVTWLEQSSHQDQRKSIFKAALYDALKSVDKHQRFRYLVTHFGAVSTQVIEDYNLYVSEFSFDDVRLEYQEKKREYLIKINETFSAIQTKALGIPVSIGLVALRLSVSNQETVVANPATDFLLFSAACIYVAMMFLLIFNQKHSLRSIKAEYKEQITRLKREYPKQHEKIKGEFKELDRRYTLQQWQLNFFIILTSIFMYLVNHYLTFDFWAYVNDTFPLIKLLELV